MPVTNPKEKGKIIEDRDSVRSTAGRRRKYVMIRPMTDPINDPSRLPIADSVKSDRAISTLLAPNAIKIRTRYALFRIALKITSEIANMNKTNVIDTTIILIVSLVSQTRTLNSMTAKAVMKTSFAICCLLLLRPFVINQAMVVR